MVTTRESFCLLYRLYLLPAKWHPRFALSPAYSKPTGKPTTERKKNNAISFEASIRLGRVSGRVGVKHVVESLCKGDMFSFALIYFIYYMLIILSYVCMQSTVCGRWGEVFGHRCKKNP